MGLALLLAGCRAPLPPAPPPPPAVHAIPATHWTNTWLGDAEAVNLQPQPDGSLLVTLTGKPDAGNKGAILSSTIPGRLTPASRVALKISAADGEIPVAVAVRTDDYYESPSQAVRPGPDADLLFDLAASDFKCSASQWRHEAAVNRDLPVQSLELVLYPAAGATRRFVLNAAGVQGVALIPPRAERMVRELNMESVRALTADAPCHGRFEIEAAVTTAAANPFDPAEIAVDGLFTAPDGRILTCPGFLFELGAEGRPDLWRVRFSPDQEGSWTWKLRVATPLNTVTSDARTLNCVASESRGGIRVSKSNPLYFEDARGDFFYPIGHNVCWNSLKEYEDQFARMNGSGENWSRIWIAAWNCEIEWAPHVSPYYGGLGWYNLENARKLDTIVDLAERNGLYLQLVLHEHCRLSAKNNPEWQNNPYNRKLGGPCDEPKDFFTNEEARRLTKNRLRYIVARWGHSSSVMAWELFNEVDLTDDFNFARDAAWHKEMAEYLKAVDPHGRMVTTSYISAPNAGTYALPAIDYTQSHIYVPDVVSHFTQIQPWFTEFGKPHFVAEFGKNTTDGVDAKDKAGRVIHSGLWAQLMQPDAGNAMSWWWYDLINPNDLYYHWAALSRFAADWDRRGENWRLLTGQLVAQNGEPLRVLALAAPERLMAWIYDPSVLPLTGKDPSPFKGELKLKRLGSGVWTVEQWDTYDGSIIARQEVPVTNGALTVPFETQGPDTAFKLWRSSPASPEAEMPALVAETWEPRASGGPARITNAIPRLAAPIAVDGRLDDWPAIEPVRVLPGDGRSPADNSFSFMAGHDADNLYVAVTVTDNHVVRTNPAVTVWQDDCVELWIDSRNDAGFFSNMPNNPGCYQFNIGPSLSEPGRADTITYRHPEWNNLVFPDLEAASQVTPIGYVIEVRVPLGKLRGSEPVKDAARIGFNVSTCDADPAGAETQWKHLLWQGKNEWDAREWSIGILE